MRTTPGGTCGENQDNKKAASIRSFLYLGDRGKTWFRAAIVRHPNDVGDDSAHGICLSVHGYGQQTEAAMIRTLPDSFDLSLTL